MNKEAEKLAVGFTGALLGNVRRPSLFAGRTSLLSRRIVGVVALATPIPKRFLEKLQLFFDESEQQRKSAFKIGRYIIEQLKK